MPGHPLQLEQLIYGWLSRIEHRKAVTIATDLGVIRQFCLHRRRHDPAAFVPSREWAPQSTESDFQPHIFSHAEIVALLERAREIRGPEIRAATVHRLILIMYCTGLRQGEAVRLRFRDVDLHNGVFTVRLSKGKTRIVPFHSDLERQLTDYLQVRQQVTECGPESPLLTRHDGQPYTSPQ